MDLIGINGGLVHTCPPLIPGPLRWHINKCLCNKRKGGMDLGSVSTGYSDKPVAMAIKIKHAGFNLTGRTLE
jgi:hypothetical protein